MATYYIDPSWTGTTSGTEEEPFSSWSQVSWTAGNSYLQKTNTTHLGGITVGTSGTSTSRIILGSYGSGEFPIIQGVSGENGINLGTRSFITVENLKVIAGSGTARNGINGLATDATTNHFIIINNCVIEAPLNSTGNGIQLRGKGDIIKNSVIQNCYQDGIFLTCSDFTLDNLVIFDFDKIRGDGDGIQLAGTHNHGNSIIKNTKIYGHIKNPQKQGIITAAGSGTFIIQNCLVTGMVTGISTAIPGTQIKSCVISDNIQRGITCAGNNISIIGSYIFNTKRGISLDIVTGISVINNTIITSEEGITALNNTSSLDTKNNIIESPIIFSIASSITITNSSNSYITSGIFKKNSINLSFLDWKAQTSTDTTSFQSNKLTSLIPTPGSNLFKAGIYVSYMTDADKNYFYNPPSIGAFEYIAPRGIR